MKTLPRKNYLSIVETDLENNFLKDVIARLPIGYAYHKIILDDSGDPVDYEFLYVNQAFENLTGLSGKNIVNKKVTEIMPGIRSDSFDWIKFYGGVAMNNEIKIFEQFFAQFNKLYRIQVSSPELYYFITIFFDISERKMMGNQERVVIECRPGADLI
jgi:diguanylate cyclase